MGIQADILFGKYNEKKVISFLNKHKNQDDYFKAYKLERKQVDFKNKAIIGELKTRTCSHDYYPDTMFGFNKMEYLRQKRQLKENETRQFIFYFLFTTGLYKWEYKEGCEKEYRVAEYIHKEKGPMPYCYVKKEFLECISSDITSKTQLDKDYLDYMIN